MMKTEENGKDKHSTGSRLRNDASNVFDCVLIVSRTNNIDKKFKLEYKYPQNFSNEEVLQQSFLFCFPFEIKSGSPYSLRDYGSHFTFILTDIEGKHRFGFCKLTDEGQKCYCVLSFLPWFEIFYKILNYIRELSLQSDEETMETMLMELHQQPMPSPHTKIQISATLSFSAPDTNSLPSIPENRNLSEYYAAVNSTFMIEIFANLMFERRVIFTSKSLSVLTSCIHSAEALLNPLHWQHIFIPVMPPHLLDYCLAPMPYLVGVHKSLLPKVRDMISMDDDIILADIDQKEIESAHSDIERMPNDTVSILKSHLRKSTAGVGENLSMTFLHVQARLIGGYRNGLKFNPGEPILFDEDKFIDSYKSTTAREFARSLVQLQTFKQFVDSRLDMLNAGVGFRDNFENEVNVLDAAGGFERDTYKEWLNMAKKGNKLIMQFQQKAKDNMKIAHQSVKNYIKQQQQLKQSSSIDRKKSLEESTKRIRPSRPPPIDLAKLNELKLSKVRQNAPPRPPPPFNRPSVPLRKKRTVQRTRHYTEIDPDHVPGTSSNDVGSETRERSKSTITYSSLDLDLLTDLEQVMDEKITNLSTPTQEEEENQAGILVDISSNTDDCDENENTRGMNEKRESVIRRRTLVKSRPDSIKATAKEQAYSSDDLSPETNPESPKLIDLSALPEPQEKSSTNVVSEPSRPTASSDLLGLDFSMSAVQDSKPNEADRNWSAFENSFEREKTPNNVFDPFLLNQTEKNSSHSVQDPFSFAPAEKTSSRVNSNPFLTGVISNESGKLTSPSVTPLKLSPQKLNRFKVNDSFEPHRSTFPTSNSAARFAGSSSAKSSPSHGANKLPIYRSHSTQGFPLRNNPSISNKFLSNSSSASPSNRPASYRDNSSPKMDKDLFSDLLVSWKSKEE